MIIRNQLNAPLWAKVIDFRLKRDIAGKEGEKRCDRTRWYNPKDGKKEGTMNILNKTREAIYV
jgi:hypothetical protein